MALDLDTVRATMPTTVPFVGTLGIEYLELSTHDAVCRLPDDARFHNHIGGAHAGAMFTLAETASGALVLSNYGEMLGEVTPLAVEVTIRYLKVARGPVTATAHMASKADAVLATLKAGGRPEFHVEVELTTGEGDDRLVTGAVTVLWTLKPNKRPETA
jgi:uncharacterized protein (TIGR00369 family)